MQNTQCHGEGHGGGRHHELCPRSHRLPRRVCLVSFSLPRFENGAGTPTHRP